ncbi:MAG: glycosyltransferase family 4 protein, partial [Acidimicrobiales bacterium]
MRGAAPAIHQFVPTLAPRDAIGAHTLAVQDLLRELGWRSEVYAWEVKPGLEGRALPYRRFARPWRRPRTWCLYQASIASVIADFLRERPEPKLLNYHNITPAELVGDWDPAVGEAVVFGRQQLARLAPATELAIAVSSFNEADLVSTGYRRTTVVPPLVDLDALACEPDAVMLDRLEAARAGGGPDWLFVGRLSPHKAQHHVVAALAAYRRAYDGRARLRLVGGAASPSYEVALRRYVAYLGLEEAVELTGSVTPGELAALYAAADVFVCCSEHEGFCVPLLEALHAGVPVVAYAA